MQGIPLCEQWHIRAAAAALTPCLLDIQVHSSSAHTASVNALSFAPHELGLALAAASSDGSVSMLTHTADAGWHTEKVRCSGFGDASLGSCIFP